MLLVRHIRPSLPGTGGNILPTVSLTSPTSGATYAPGSNISLAATASDADGTITKVEFYRNDAAGSTLIGTDTSSPYTATDSNVSAGSYTYIAKAYDNLNATADSAGVMVTVTASQVSVNVAAAANGAVATATSTHPDSSPANAINGDRKGLGNYWNDFTPDVFPDTLTVTFAGPQTIQEINVFSVQDNYAAPLEPTPTMTFTQYGLLSFTLEYYNGSIWVNLATVSNNNLVWKSITFAPVTTSQIRINVTNVNPGDPWSRIVEIEAWTSGAAANLFPSVSMSLPNDGQTFSAPATINLSASASDIDGTITKIEFYRGATLINTVTAAIPGSTLNANYPDVSLAAGAYSYTAKAYDDDLAVTTSTAKAVTVVTPVTGNDWQARSTAPGVFTAHELAAFTATDIGVSNAQKSRDPFGLANNAQGYNAATLDTVIKPPGSAASLRWRFRGSPDGVALGDPGSVGDWFCNWSTPYASGSPGPHPQNNIFGQPGDHFYLSVLWRCNTAWAEVDAISQAPNEHVRIGHKMMDLAGGDRFFGIRDFGAYFTSSDNGKLVLSTSAGHGPNAGPGAASRMYAGLYGYYFGSSDTDGMAPWRTDVYPQGDFDRQYRNHSIPYVSYIELSQNVPGWQHPAARGLIIPNEWMEWYWDIEILSGGPTSVVTRMCHIKIYQKILSSGSRELVQDFPFQEVVMPYMDGDDPSGNGTYKIGYGSCYLFNYLTNKSQNQIHPDMDVWYSSFIGSRQPIAEPGTTAIPPPGGPMNPTWRASAPLNTWVAIPNSTPNAMDLRASWEPAGAIGTSNQWNNVTFDDYGGPAWDETRGFAYQTCSGGHATPPSLENNAVFKFDAVTNGATRWSVLTEATDHRGQDYGNRSYYPSDGRPTPRHRGWASHVVDINGLPVIVQAYNMFATFAWGGPYGNPPRPIANLSTDAYHIGRTPEPWDLHVFDGDVSSPNGWGIPSGVGFEGPYPGMAKDPRTQFLWLWDSWGVIWFLNTQTRTWHAYTSIGYGGHYNGCCIDTVRNRFVSASPVNQFRPGVKYINMTGSAAIQEGNVTGPAAPYFFLSNHSILYDSIVDRYLYIALTRSTAPVIYTMFAINPDTWVSTDLGPVEDPNPTTGHSGVTMFTKAEFIPGLRGVLYIPSFYKPAYFYAVAP